MRVLSRTPAKAKRVLQETTGLTHDAFQNRTRSAKCQMKQSMEAARQRGEHAERAMPGAYRRLVEIMEAVQDQARHVGAALREQATDQARARRYLDEALRLGQQVGDT